MARVSTKENKNIYHKARESRQLTREAASELLETMSPERIEKIENERSLPHPDEVLLLAEKYRKPELCNYYCANQCPIGQQYVPEVKVKDLSQIVLELLASLNAVSKQKDRLIEITADGEISDDQLEDFIGIQDELERISIAAETLQFWCEKMLADGVDVICDRYYYSSLAYQGSETDERWVREMNLNCPEIRRPDICVFLDLTPEQSMERIGKGRVTTEIYENAERLERVRRKFYSVFEALRETDRICVVNAARTVEEIHEEIYGLI